MPQPQNPEKEQTPRALVIWMTGISGAGKSTLANRVKSALSKSSHKAFVLDGDELRQGLNAGLGFSEEDRKENIRRTAEVARLFSEAGIVTLVALISPFTHARQMAREIIGQDHFFELFVHCPISVARQRDPKGLYAKADAGVLKNFTGIDSAYEAPENADLEIRTDLLSPEKCTLTVLQAIQTKLFPPARTW